MSRLLLTATIYFYCLEVGQKLPQFLLWCLGGAAALPPVGCCFSVELSVVMRFILSSFMMSRFILVRITGLYWVMDPAWIEFFYFDLDELLAPKFALVPLLINALY